MKSSQIALLLTVIALGCLLAALANLLLLETASDLPFHLFQLSLLIFSLALFLEFKRISNYFSRSYFWFGPRQALRVGALVLITILSLYTSYQRPNHFDWTAEGIHTLNPASIALWKPLDFSLELFSDPVATPGHHRALKQFLQSLGSANQKTKIQWIHPLKEPGKLRLRGIKTLPALVVTLKKQGFLTLDRHQLFMRSRRGLKFLGESALNRALIRLSNRQNLMLSWPGKSTLPSLDPSPNGYSELISILRADGYQSSTTDTLPLSSTPLLVFLPEQPLTKSQQNLLIQRKKLSFPTLLFYDTQPQDPMALAHQYWKLNFYPHPVADPLRPVGRELSWIRPTPQSHPITRDLDLMRFPVIFPGSASFSCARSPARSILKSSAMSWVERTLTGLKLPVYDPDQDLKGPLSLACELSPKFLLFGDQDFLRNQFLELAGNRTLILNALHHSLKRPEFLGQRYQEIEVRRIQANPETNRIFIVSTLIILPAFCFGLATILYLWKL
jgi:hypothetical protein